MRPATWNFTVWGLRLSAVAISWFVFSAAIACRMSRSRFSERRPVGRVLSGVEGARELRVAVADQA
jgi:hypothetical protein